MKRPSRLGGFCLVDSNFCTVRLDFVNTHRPTVGVRPRVHHRRLQALTPYIRGLVNDLTFFIEKQLIHSIHWFLPFCRGLMPPRLGVSCLAVIEFRFVEIYHISRHVDGDVPNDCRLALARLVYFRLHSRPIEIDDLDVDDLDPPALRGNTVLIHRGTDKAF